MWSPPVKKIPVIIDIIIEDSNGQKLFLNNKKIIDWIKPINKPIRGPNLAILINWGLVKGIFGKIV